MRVSDKVFIRRFLTDLMDSREKLLKLEHQNATGKKFDLPEEDPVGSVRSMRLHRVLNENGQFTKNMDEAISWLNITDSALDHLTSIIHRVRERTIAGANGTMSQLDREAIADEIDRMREEVLQIANTSLGGRYIFGGYETKEKPYAFGENNVAVYRGDEGEMAWEIENGETIVVNVPGNKVFATQRIEYRLESDAHSSASIFGPGEFTIRVGDSVYRVDVPAGANISVIADRINLRAGDAVDAYVAPEGSGVKLVIQTKRNEHMSLSDEVGAVLQDIGILNKEEDMVYAGDLDIFETMRKISEDLRYNRTTSLSGPRLEELDEYLDHLLRVRARVGAKVRRLEATKRRFEDNKVQVTSLLSRIEDVDIAEAIMELTNQQAIYRSALRTGARIVQTSLIDFLR
ncbi:MAG: flagellar hook-associated protein FlgL [Synergistetes bacterium]|nr:flagellar hook-associated protein FlgL [Synergistota bacterium]